MSRHIMLPEDPLRRDCGRKRNTLASVACILALPLFVEALDGGVGGDALVFEGQKVIRHDAANVLVTQCEATEPATDCCAVGGGIGAGSGGVGAGNGGVGAGDGQTSTDCAWITISTGNLRPGALLPPGFFELKVEEPSPEIFTPARLYYVLKALGSALENGVYKEEVICHTGCRAKEAWQNGKTLKS